MNATPPALPPPLDAEVFTLDGPAGRLSCYHAGPPRSALGPMMLVHSVNAAASAYEVRPVFEHHRTLRPVLAFDLPGFGLSERGPRPYTPRMMTDAVLTVAAEGRRRHGGARLDALGLSLGSEFVTRAAVEQPEWFRSLTLVSPTGFSGGKRFYGPPGSSREVALARALLVGRPWSPTLFRWLTQPRVVRHFLQRTFGGKLIDEGLWKYCVMTAAQPGALHAPLAFLSAALFSADINRLYESLTLPVWMVHGDRGDFVDYRGESTVAGRPGWSFRTMQTGALPYFERPEEFFRAHDEFLARAGPGLAAGGG